MIMILAVVVVVIIHLIIIKERECFNYFILVSCFLIPQPKEGP